MNYYNDKEKEQIYRREITQRRQPKKTNRRKWQGHTQNMYWCCDLIDFSTISNFNRRFSYILVCEDLYSRYVFAEKMIDKNTNHLKQAFDKIFDQSRNPITDEIEYPNFIAFDKESAINDELKDYLSTKGIKVYNPMGKFGVSPVERFIRTFKEDLSYYFTGHRKNWVDHYKDIVDNYNKRKHTSLRNKKGLLEPEIVQTREDDYKEKEHPKLNKTDKTEVFHVGDRVRFLLNKNLFKLKKKSLLHSWSPDIYVVTKVDKSKYPYGYRIKAVNPKINTPYDAAKMRNSSLDGNITSYTQYVQELKEANNRLFYANELKRTSL